MKTKTRKPAKRYRPLACGCCDSIDCRETINHQIEWREAQDELADDHPVVRRSCGERDDR
jgi:hypothetical protein